MSIIDMGIVNFLKSDFQNELQYGDFLRQPIAEEFVRAYRIYLGYEDTNGNLFDVEELQEQLNETTKEKQKIEKKRNDLEKKVEELEKAEHKRETTEIDENNEIDRLIMTIKMLKPSYVKSYKSEDNTALSPEEIEKIIYRVQRKSIEEELKNLTDILQAYKYKYKDEEALNDAKEELNHLLEKCPYSDLQYNIRQLLKI
jgi:DNA repair exonuclease SbcCD ATPase subunit